MCLWNEIEKYESYLNRIGIVGKAINPFYLMYVEDNPENHLKRAINYSEDNNREERSIINHQSINKIRIGYFSSDFRNHPVSVSSDGQKLAVTDRFNNRIIDRSNL